MKITDGQIEAVVDWMNTWDQLRGTIIPLRFKEAFRDKNPIRPPIGLTPRWVRDEERKHEIFLAMERYIDSGKDIPHEWIEEYVTLERKTSEARCNPSMG